MVLRTQGLKSNALPTKGRIAGPTDVSCRAQMRPTAMGDGPALPNSDAQPASTARLAAYKRLSSGAIVKPAAVTNTATSHARAILFSALQSLSTFGLPSRSRAYGYAWQALSHAGPAF